MLKCLNRYLCVLMTGSTLLFTSCCSYSPRGIEKPAQDYSHEINQLRLVVIKLGIPESKAEQMKLGELVAEIKNKMNDSSVYCGDYYSDEDLRRIPRLMSGEKHLIQILNDYHQFIQNVKGKRLIVLPEE